MLWSNFPYVLMSCDYIDNGQLSDPSLRCAVSEEQNWIDLRRNLLQQRRFPIDSLQQEREETTFLSVCSCLGFVEKFVSLLYTCMRYFTLQNYFIFSL